MKLSLVFLGAFLGSGLGAVEGEDALLGEKLNFIERNVLALLRRGEFPQMYDSSYPKIQECSCYYAPTNINFGTGVGMTCHTEARFLDGELADGCGLLCNDPHNMDVALFCPSGWDSECDRGCFPPDQFRSVPARLKFWEESVAELLLYATDYLSLDPEYLQECGCEHKPSPIRYGTKVGFVCKMKKDFQPGDRCIANYQCADENKTQVVTFCPAGHKATCRGCEKDYEGKNSKDLHVRADWLISVVAGVTRESLENLGWTPRAQQMLSCGCSSNLQPVVYGRRMGFYCEVKDAELITPECGHNVLCLNDQGKDVLHFCPDGFKASCHEGCTFPWVAPGKPEL